MASPAPQAKAPSLLVTQPLLNSIPPSLLPLYDPTYVAYYNKHSAGRLATHQIPISAYRADPAKYTILYGRQRIRSCYRITDQQCPVTPHVPAAPAPENSQPQSSIAVRIFEPRPDAPGLKNGKRAVYINFHGGGWVFGGLPADKDFCKRLAWEVGCVCIDVDYRLAPEFPYPIPVDDCWAAFNWVISSKMEEFSLDPLRIAVGGCSAGGHLATVVAHLCRDQNIPLAFQLLGVPVVDLHIFSPTGELLEDQPYESYRTNRDSVPLPLERMSFFHNHFLGCPRAASLDNDWRVSPIRAPNFSHLAPALVITSSLDILRDEGEAYALKMNSAGSKAKVVRIEGVPHTFMQMDDILEGGKRYNAESVKALTEAFA